MSVVVTALIVWTACALVMVAPDFALGPDRPDNRVLRIIRAHPIYLVGRLLTPVFRYLFEDLS